MKELFAPLSIGQGRLRQTKNTKESIDNALAMLITTPKGSWQVDGDYGFVFNNLRFEIFNENEGVVYDSTDNANFPYGENSQLYEKKVSGSSKNLNTFAAELKDSIVKYERRITNVTVAMTYIREERQIYVSVKGTVVATQEPYHYKTTIKVWN